MDKNKSQAYNYAREVIPVMFHSQTRDFFKYLERDGLQFLEFWWNHIGGQLPESQQRPFEGMAFDLLPAVRDYRLVVITLPPPQEEGEIFYLLLVGRPERRFAWVKLPNAHVIALVRRPTLENPNATEIGEITPGGSYVRTRKGPEPTLQNMKKIAENAIRPPSA